METLDESLNYYSNLMLDYFKKSEIYKKFYIEAANLNCKIKVDCGKSIYSKGCLFPLSVLKAYLGRSFIIPLINKYKLNTNMMGKNLNISKLFKDKKTYIFIMSKLIKQK